MIGFAGLTQSKAWHDSTSNTKCVMGYVHAQSCQRVRTLLCQARPLVEPRGIYFLGERCSQWTLAYVGPHPPPHQATCNGGAIVSACACQAVPGSALQYQCIDGNRCCNNVEAANLLFGSSFVCVCVCVFLGGLIVCYAWQWHGGAWFSSRFCLSALTAGGSSGCGQWPAEANWAPYPGVATYGKPIGVALSAQKGLDNCAKRADCFMVYATADMVTLYGSGVAGPCIHIYVCPV